MQVYVRASTLQDSIYTVSLQRPLIDSECTARNPIYHPNNVQYIHNFLPQRAAAYYAKKSTKAHTWGRPKLRVNLSKDGANAALSRRPDCLRRSVRLLSKLDGWFVDKVGGLVDVCEVRGTFVLFFECQGIQFCARESISVFRFSAMSR